MSLVNRFTTLLALLAVWLSTNAAIAATPDAGFAPKFIQQANKHTTRFVEKATELRMQDPEIWLVPDQQFYLSNALWAVYSATVSYTMLHGELPANPQDVVSEGLLSVWPGNPYRNWEPMSVAIGISSFSAGDLIFQICPAALYSFGSDGRELVPLSFQFGIYGPDSEFARFYGNAQVIEENSGWATVPPDVAFLLGSWAEPAEDGDSLAAGGVR